MSERRGVIHRLPEATITGLGLTVFFVNLYHFLQMSYTGLLTVIVIDALPMAAGLIGFPLAAYLVRDWGFSCRVRLAGWILLGGVFGFVSALVIIWQQMIHGLSPVHSYNDMVLLSQAGAIGGGVIGLYDSRLRRDREELRSFKSAVENAGHAILITDTDGVIEYVNPEFESLTGYSEDEVLGERPSILKSGRHDDDFYNDLWNTVLSGEVWEGEIVNQRKDGETYHIEQTIAPILNDEGEIERLVAINNDITERKEMERELERQNERLEEFAEVVSHDLRNPLNVAEGYLEVVLCGNGDDREDCLENVQDSLDRMEGIIEDVLRMARQDGEIDVTATRSLGDDARTAWEHIEFSDEDAQIEVVDSVEIDADRDRLIRLLENLFRNSVEHGGDDVTVRVGATDGGFYVEDDGEGIPEDERDEVLESGYTTSETGTGLGLSVVKRIADAHGWEVSISESEDGGARFEFDVGLRRVSESES
ncbi:nitrogen regulation protein NR(II) [Halorutilales archaeon Cl-col2-1]